MVGQRYEIYLGVFKSISHECRAQFCLLYKPTYYDDLFNILEDFPKILKMLTEGHSNVPEDFRRFPKITKENSKFFRLNID